MRLRGGGGCQSRATYAAAVEPPVDAAAIKLDSAAETDSRAAAAAAATRIRVDASRRFSESRRSSTVDDISETSGASHWSRRGGASLESLLAVDATLGGEAPVRLLDAAYLIALAETGSSRLLSRGELAAAAFLSLDELQSLGRAPGGALRVIVVSHAAWRQANELDSSGHTLGLVARALRAYVEDREDGGSYGVFIDMCSLPPAPRLRDEVGGAAASGVAAGAELHRRAVAGLSELFSHPRTIVMKVTSARADAPAGCAYHARGWTIAEEAMAHLTKQVRHVLDLSRMPSDEELRAEPFVDAAGAVRWSKVRSACAPLPATRRPPLTPAAFGDALGGLSFARAEEERPTVLALYTAAFSARLGEATQLYYSYLGWGDEEALLLAAALQTGAAVQLERLFLSSNDIGDAGLGAIIDALAHGASPKLRELSLHANPGLSERALADARAALEPRRCYVTLSDEFHIDQTARRRSVSAQL